MLEYFCFSRNFRVFCLSTNVRKFKSYKDRLTDIRDNTRIMCEFLFSHSRKRGLSSEVCVVYHLKDTGTQTFCFQNWPKCTDITHLLFYFILKHWSVWRLKACSESQPGVLLFLIRIQHYCTIQVYKVVKTLKAHVDRAKIQPYHSPPLYSAAKVKWVVDNRIKGGYMEEFIFCYKNIVLCNNVKR